MAEVDRLERRLADLARAVDWPQEPDLRPGLRARLARARRRRVRLLLAAAVLAAVLAGGAAAAAAVGLRGATIQRVPRLASPSPAPLGSVGQRLGLGVRYDSMAEAETSAGFRALVPASLGQPDEVYYRRSPGVLTLVYRPRPGLPATSDPDVGALVMEASAAVDSQSFGKLAGPGTSVRPVTVNGGPGFWISGARHGFFFYRGAGGQADEFRLAGDVLIWNQAGLVVRVESGLNEQHALAVAGTVRRPPV
jgi:hypothetical protein